MKVIIAGGGTGGHVYPAIAIGQALTKIDSSVELLFIGAEGKLEMNKVPKAGFNIEGLDIRGFERKISFKNFKNLLKLNASIRRSKKIIRSFNPDVVVGVGGYASGPPVYVAQKLKIPTLLLEQNSFPGITNKLLGKKANKICVAYNGMDQFFEKSKILLSGNPVREDLAELKVTYQEAIDYFGLETNKKTILLFGGSLGARTLNDAVKWNHDLIAKNNDVQLIWQIGKLYEKDYLNCSTAKLSNIYPMTYIDRMDLAYRVADLVICRAGALTISELSLVKKPAIFVPSPNVSEDHQTKNAMALVDANAGFLVKDADASTALFEEALVILNDEKRQNTLSQSIAAFGMHSASTKIANEIMSLANA